MPDEQSIIEPTAGPGVPEHAAASEDTAVRRPETLAYDPLGEDDREWDEPAEDLPRRPRRRLLGVGGNSIALALLGVLLIACGFIGGVLVEKGQSSSSSSGGTGATGLASRFAVPRASAGADASGASTGGASAGGASAGGASTGGASTGGSFFGRGGGGGVGAAGATAGQVAYLSGNTLYVSTAEGNTVKVTTSPGSTVTKTVKADVKSIHPGETVLITGTAGKNGAISAESISAGAGGAGGGLGALFGGSGGGGGGGGRSGTSSSGGSAGGGTGGGGAGTGGGEPALFGKGG